jgi:DNA-binding protein H-NS
MSEINVSWGELSPEQLDELVDRAIQEKSTKQEGRIAVLKDDVLKVEAEAKALGFNIRSLLTPKKSAVKFVNPANNTMTWSGRGKKPGWLVELQAQGIAVEPVKAD